MKKLSLSSVSFLSLLFCASLQADTFTITNADASGPGSLSAAVDWLISLPFGTPAVFEFDTAFFSTPRVLRQVISQPTYRVINRSVEINGPPLIGGRPAFTIDGDVNGNGVSDAGDAGGLGFVLLNPDTHFTARRIGFLRCGGQSLSSGQTISLSGNGVGSLTLEDCYLEGSRLRTPLALSSSNANVNLLRCVLRDNILTSSVASAMGLEVAALNATQCRFEGNANSTQSGGLGTVRINTPSATFAQCYFANNLSRKGGAILLEGGQLACSACTFTRNTTSLTAALSIETGAAANLTNCTFEGNAGHLAGAIFNDGTLIMTNTTATRNIAGFDLDVSAQPSPTIYLSSFGTNSLMDNVVADNFSHRPPQPTLADFNGAPSSGGGNVVGVGSAFYFNSSHDLVGASGTPQDPKLGPLQHNGGLVPTCAPQKGSVCINNGVGAAVLTDARGQARFGAGPDSGAVEYAILNFNQWAALQPFAANQTGQYSDPDGDGYTNLLEYFTGTDPLAPTASVLTVHPAGNQFRMTYPVADHVATGQWRATFEITQNLTNWNPSSQTPASVGPEGNTTRYEVFFNATTTSKRFARMLVESVP